MAKKIDSNALVRRIKNQGRPEKKNFTFRFDEQLMKQFREACESRGITATSVLEDLMRSFLAGF